MNILGHSYIATHAVAGDTNLLIIGSLLPELSPFVANSPFTWEEIHESGKKLLYFCRKNNPAMADFARGVLSHSVKYGADKFNQEIESYAGKERNELIREIAAASSLNVDIARSRLHNFLWWGVEIQILQNQPNFVLLVKKALDEVDINMISQLLAEVFVKEEKEVAVSLWSLFRDIYRTEDLDSIEGLARTWARQTKGLPEKDSVDVQKTVSVFAKCAKILKDDWEKIIEKVVDRTNGYDPGE